MGEIDDSIHEYDVIVIGGGPAGITAAIRCMNHHLSVILLEGRKLGGQLTQLYPTKFIYDYSSYPEIRAGYLADRMVHHAKYKNVPMLEEYSDRFKQIDLNIYWGENRVFNYELRFYKFLPEENGS